MNKNKFTLAEEGYQYVKNLGEGTHLLMPKEGKILEVWQVNKNHASYGLKWRNTHLEFCRSIKVN